MEVTHYVAWGWDGLVDVGHWLVHSPDSRDIGLYHMSNASDKTAFRSKLGRDKRAAFIYVPVPNLDLMGSIIAQDTPQEVPAPVQSHGAL